MSMASTHDALNYEALKHEHVKLAV